MAENELWGWRLSTATGVVARHGGSSELAEYGARVHRFLRRLNGEGEGSMASSPGGLHRCGRWRTAARVKKSGGGGFGGIMKAVWALAGVVARSGVRGVV